MMQHIITVLAIAVVTTHAAVSSELYWKSVLPNTSMPQAIKDSLESPGGTAVGVGKGGVSVGSGTKGKPVRVRGPAGNPFDYNYAATEDQINNKQNIQMFLLAEDLHIGKQLNLKFPGSSNLAAFLSPSASKKIPFSSLSIKEVLNRFSVKPGSVEEDAVKKTVKECEEHPIIGEEKLCATSLESMVEFATSKLGKNLHVFSTEAEGITQLVKYKIVGVKKLPCKKSVVCHKMEYVYAVFYCHSTLTTEAYKISLLGAKEIKAEAIAVCHSDTSGWNPHHLAFQLLNVKPGKATICHFLPQDHLIWVPK